MEGLRACLALLLSVAAILGACAGPPPPAGGAASPPALVLRGVTLIDGTGAPPRHGAMVVVRSGVVREIGDAAALAIPRGAQVIEGKGRFLIPGLWDAHVHLSFGDEATLGVLVANGITAVRDMGGDLERLDGWRSRVDSGELVGPRIFRAGPVVDGPKPGVPHRLTVMSPQQGRDAVERLAQLGVDFIKLHTAVPRDAFFSLAAEARRRGLPFAGHVPMAVEPAEAVAAGQRSVEHIATLIEGRYMARFRGEAEAMEALPEWIAKELPGLAAAFARQGTWFDPTLVAYEVRARRGELAANPDPRIRYVDDALRKFWEQAFPLNERDRDPEVAARRRRFVELGMEMTRRLREAGAGIVTGSDLGARDVLPGFAVHAELALLAQAGLRPMEVLQAATAEPAKLLRADGTLGTVAPGKAADLVLLEADPLADPGNFGKIAGVVLRGRFLDRAELDALLARAAARATGAPRGGEPGAPDGPRLSSPGGGQPLPCPSSGSWAISSMATASARTRPSSSPGATSMP